VLRSRPRTALQRLRLVVGAALCGGLSVGAVDAVLRGTPHSESISLGIGLLLTILILFAWRRTRRAIAISDERLSTFENRWEQESLDLRELWMAEYDRRSDQITLIARGGETFCKIVNLVPRSEPHGRQVAEILTRRAREASNSRD